MSQVGRAPRFRPNQAFLALLACLGAVPAWSAVVFINEIHYDNTGTDTGEAIEIAGPAGTDLTGWSLVLYNGSNGLVYTTTSLSGVLPNQQSGFGTGFVNYPTNGIQNGSPDGIALVDSSSTVIQFLSYEGTFTAGDGPASGMTSVDIGVAESTATPLGDSLQLTGSGTTSDDFTWAAAMAATFGVVNTGQSFGGGPVDPLINEFVFNHTGSDSHEFVEVLGSASTDYSAFTVVEIEGDSTSAGLVDDGTVTLGTTGATGFWFTGFANSVYENGSVTLLLVENFTGVVGDDIDIDNDGTIDNPLWDRIVDSVAVTDGGGSDRAYSTTVLAPGFDGNGFTPGGASRIPNGSDTDSAADWLRNDFDGEGLPGFSGTPAFGEAFNTPEAENEAVPPPSAPAIVITEILQNPGAVSDTDGEWFELFNPTPDPVDINGWTIRDNGSNTHVISNGGPLLIGSGSFLVLGRNADFAANGGVVVDYQYSGFFLGNSDDEVVLLDTNLVEVDRVEYDGGPSFPDPNGAAMALKAPSLDNNVGGNWCESQTPFGDGDRGTPGSPNDCLARLVINEVDADTPGSDMLEFVELYDGGDGGTDLGGLVAVFFNGNGDVSYRALDLDGFSTDADGFFVLGNSAVGPDLVFPNNGLQNGADAVALYAADAADFPNGTPVTTDKLVDALVYDTNDALDPGLLALLNAGQPQVNEGGAGNKDFHSNQRCPNGFGGQRNTDTYAQGFSTPGAINNCAPLEIFTIQGSGASSPFDGFIVSTEDNAVTAVGVDGFFMQTPAARSDGDVDTSDGIFVFTGGPPLAAVGDLVDVVGAVNEFFGLTEFSLPLSVVVDPGAATVPAPVVFDATVPSPDPTAPSCAIEFECYEGMLVEITGGAVTGPNQRFGPDPIAEVHITAGPGRTFREPGVEFPGLGMPPIPTWDGNPEVFELDPDKLGLPNQIIFAGSSFDATGVIGFEFGGYELWPSELTVDPISLPDAVRPRAPGEFTVATLNMFRFFDDFDDPPSVNFLGGIRNDSVVSTADYLLRRAKFVAHILGVLDAPDILAVEEVEKLEVLQELADDIELVDPGVVYAPFLEEGNDIGTIDVGFLVRDTIAVDAVTQLGLTEIFVNPLTGEDNVLHDRPPLLLEGRCIAGGADFSIAVMVVHNRSLGSIEDPVDGVRVRQKRFEQAESIAHKVQDLQDADPGVHLVVIGDFNAFEFTDGFVDGVGQIQGEFTPDENLVCQTNVCDDLVNPDLANQVESLSEEERYSFIFRGNAQAIDHALTGEGLNKFIRGAEYGRGNADAAFALVDDDGTLADLAVRSSDHDGLVLFLMKDTDGDGVPDDVDVCPGTTIPESVPTERLGVNRWALVDNDGVFDTTLPPGGGGGPGLGFTVGDTAGCSCEQIIVGLGLGQGHVKFGCSSGAMQNWVALVNP